MEFYGTPWKIMEVIPWLNLENFQDRFIHVFSTTTSGLSFSIMESMEKGKIWT